MNFVHPRLARELRPLLLPWSVAAFAGLGNLIGLFSQGAFASFLTGLPGIAFVVGCLFLAAWPMGSEFHHRTLPLLLSQPHCRFRLWREKMVATSLGIGALTLVYVATIVAQGEKVSLEDALPWAGFIGATASSAAVFTLGARSVLGGMVLTGGCQFAVALGVTGMIYGCYKMLGLDPEDPALARWPTIVAYVSAGVVYAAFTLWLGWRKWAELEARDAPEWQPVSLPAWVTPKKLATLLRCQSAGNLANLIRKELSLQRPVFVIAVFTSACWILTLMLFILQPARAELFQGIFGGLAVTHVVLSVLLAGCVPLGEEKALGLADWHLTLPASARRQWAVKLLVGAGTAVLLGLALPLAWSGLALVKGKVGLLAIPTEAMGVPAGLLTILFVLGFWSAAMLESAVRAALATVMSVIGLGLCVSLALWISELFFPHGLQSDLITTLLARCQLPPGFLSSHDAAILSCVPLAVLAVLLVALVQSFAHFRCVQVRNAVIFQSALALAAVAFASAFWCADLVKSIQSQSDLGDLELGATFSALPQFETKIAAGKPWPVTPQELERTGGLSGRAKTWLRNSSIMVYPSPLRHRNMAEIRLPDQKTFLIHLPTHRRNEKPSPEPNPPK